MPGLILKDRDFPGPWEVEHCVYLERGAERPALLGWHVLLTPNVTVYIELHFRS